MSTITLPAAIDVNLPDLAFEYVGRHRFAVSMTKPVRLCEHPRRNVYVTGMCRCGARVG